MDFYRKCARGTKMSQQHIEELENRIFGQLPFKAKAKDIKLIIEYAKEQAERVEELEYEVDRLNGALHYQLKQENIRNEENRKLRHKNKRYREEIDRALGEGVTTEDCNEAIDRVYGILGKVLEGEE